MEEGVGKRKAGEPDREEEPQHTQAAKRHQPSLAIVGLNHVSRETDDVGRLLAFYREVLGLTELDRPAFPFGGAWLRLQVGVALHLIERDPAKPEAGAGPPAAAGDASSKRVPERFIRRAHHIALTVPNIASTRKMLAAKGISYAVNGVDGTSIVQLFLYDPDGNGVELGNFEGEQQVSINEACGQEKLSIIGMNHVSRETDDVARLQQFYHEVLGLPLRDRPAFPFGGAWLQLQPGLELHIIERDLEKPAAAAGEPLSDAALSGTGQVPECFIRRGHHLAVTVRDIEATKAALGTRGLRYAENVVDGTSIVQLFLYDPDGNGVEVGNFDSA